jgi:hypothetical protein
MAYAVGGQEHASADFAEGRSLLVDGYLEPVGDERIRREQTADPASDDNDR